MLRQLTVLAILISASQLLQAAPPSLERLYPAAGQRGAPFSVTVTGAGLQNVAEVMFYSPDVRCERLEPRSDNELVLHLIAVEHCRPGMYPFRVRSAEGISELQVIGISRLPVVAESEPNDALESAQRLSADEDWQGTTIVGTVEAGDVDSFCVTLRKGDRLSAEAEAMRAGGAMLDVVLNVLSPQGDWLAVVDDTPLRRQDPVVSVIAPSDGDYIIQLHESNFEGDESSRYALHIGPFPAPQWVYPAGGPTGQTVSVTFGGDATGAITQELVMQHSSGTTQLFCEHQGRPAVSGIPFRVSPFANVMEQEPNDALAETGAPSTTLPIALNGFLQEPGDVDGFRIRAEAGQKINVEVYASRIGSPADTLLEIRSLTGQVIAAGDDGISHDSHVAVTFPESAEYIVRITDKRGNGGDGFIYRVELSAFEPQVTTFLSRPNRLSQERQSIVVPRGNRVVTFLACQRSGFTGDVSLAVSGLPEGLHLPGAVIPSDRFWVPMIIEADANAEIGGRLVQVEASGSTTTGSVIGNFRQVVDLVAGSADQLFQSAEVDRLAVAVIDEVPYSIHLSDPVSSLAPDGTVNLEIVATRAEGFHAPLEVTLPFLPPWVDGPDKVIIPADQTKVTYPIHAWPKAVPRTWTICAEAKPGLSPDAMPDRTGMNEDRRRPSKPLARTAVASNPVSLKIDESPVVGSIAMVVAEQGKPCEVVCVLERRADLPDQLTAVLEGLPNRVTASAVQVASGDREIRFVLTPEQSCPVGTFPDLMVRLDGTMKDQSVSWMVGRGSVLRIEPAGLLVTDPDGKPLSKLDVLRQKSQRN